MDHAPGRPIPAATRRRAGLLAAVAGLALLVAACGRASDEEISALLGITPTATRSAEQLASATAASAARATSQASAVAAAGPGSPAAAGLALGNASQGRNWFSLQCLRCHGPNGAGGNILEPGGPGAALTPDALLAYLRDEGSGHPNPPGPYTPVELSDRQVADLAAYIIAQAGG